MSTANTGFISDSQAVVPIVEWEAVEVTQVQRAAFGALRTDPKLLVTVASQDEWDDAQARFKESLANVSTKE